MLLDELQTHYRHQHVNDQLKRDEVYIHTGIVNCTQIWQQWDQINGVFKQLIQQKIYEKADEQVDQILPGQARQKKNKLKNKKNKKVKERKKN